MKHLLDLPWQLPGQRMCPLPSFLNHRFCGKVGRNTVTDGGPVTVTGNRADSQLQPVITRFSEGLSSVGPQTVTSGGPVTVTGNEPLLPKRVY